MDARTCTVVKQPIAFFHFTTTLCFLYMKASDVFDPAAKFIVIVLWLRILLYTYYYGSIHFQPCSAQSKLIYVMTVENVRMHD